MWINFINKFSFLILNVPFPICPQCICVLALSSFLDSLRIFENEICQIQHRVWFLSHNFANSNIFQTRFSHFFWKRKMQSLKRINLSQNIQVCNWIQNVSMIKGFVSLLLKKELLIGQTQLQSIIRMNRPILYFSSFSRKIIFRFSNLFWNNFISDLLWNNFISDIFRNFISRSILTQNSKFLRYIWD